MDTHPLTPPQETNPTPSFGTQEDEDIDFHKRWLRCRGIKIDTLISEHNRVTIPIEEDIQLLIRLKELVEALPEPASIDQVVEDFTKQLKEAAEVSKRKSAIAAFKYYMPPLPEDVYPDFHSFLRSRSSNSTDAMIYGVFPYLIDQINAAKAPIRGTTEDRLMSSEKADNHKDSPTASESIDPPMLKRSKKAFRVEKLRKRERTEPSIRKHAQSRKGNFQDYFPTHVRRSPRLRKRQAAGG